MKSKPGGSDVKEPGSTIWIPLRLKALLLEMKEKSTEPYYIVLERVLADKLPKN